MRLFIALDIDDVIRQHIERFVEGVTGFAPDARWARPEALHVTLKFIGEQPEAAIEPIKQALSNLRARATELNFRGYGFFPTVKSARVFWIGVEADPQLAALASAIDGGMPALGIEQEARVFSPHLTLARSSSSSGSPRRNPTDSPKRNFHRLQEKLAALPAPEFGNMTAREFFLYRSQLSPKGSKYTKLAAFDLNVARILK
jgi:2'-5' RNA ligase